MAKEFILQMRYCAAKCDECLFGKNKIVSDKRKRQILQELKKDGRHFFCHLGTINGENIICAGSIDAGHNKELLDKARAMNMLVPVDPKDLKTNKHTNQ